MAKEYIAREAALNASKIVYIEYIEVDGEGYEEGNADDIPVVFKKDIEAIPAADVRPVVRCKDCVHYDKGKNDSESWMYCKVLAKDVYDDFYCKLGEGRDVQDES